MAENRLTPLQKLSRMFRPEGQNIMYGMPSSSMSGGDNDIILRTHNKEDYDMAVLQARQQNLLAKEWRKAEFDISNKTLANLTTIKMMYRDADLMDDFPEIGAAIDIVMEESTYINDKGFMLNISSKSERVKKILQDLFYNRLQININLPMVCRAMVKYGNEFMLLNIDANNGVMGWKQLPVYEIERFENGMANPYTAPYTSLNTINPDQPIDTQFIWVGQNEFIPYKNWQIAHFRLLYDSKFLPYGVSFLQKARRHFRMLSMMEDMMLIYRLERSWERRVFKINVGGVDPQDVPALIQEVANNFKRTPIIDPATGQIDLRKNIMSSTEDYFIPVRDDAAPNPIETLSAAQNLTAMDDIKFVEDKVLTALRVPKSFVSFDTEKAEGKNLSLLDIRFTKTVNRIQQYLIMELNKIAMIHLQLLGFEDDLTNFSLTMNNPSSQAQMLELENLSKRITAAKDAVSDPGGGIPVYSMTRAWKEIMGWSDKEIKDNLEEIRLEKALVTELENTPQIIKRTHIFDPVDNVYGEIGAEYQEGGQGGEGDDGMGGAMGGGGIGGGLDFGGDDMGGMDGEMDMGDAAAEEGPDTAGAPAGDEQGGLDAGAPPEGLAESVLRSLETRTKKKMSTLAKEGDAMPRRYLNLLEKRIDSYSKESKTVDDVDDLRILHHNHLLNERLDEIRKQLDEKETLNPSYERVNLKD